MCNSISFLDTLTLKREDGNPVPVLNTGIAWPSDKQMKFRNPPNSQTNLSEGKNQFKAWPYIWYLHHCFFFPFLTIVYKDYVKPQNWRKNIWELDPINPENNGLQNEDLIVWMRTAALPTFRKLYRRLNRTAEGYNSGLKAGNYILNVEYSKRNHFKFRL
jgi:hypothetical protein